MSSEIRASTHNGRSGKKGVFSAKHNDRQFDTSTTDHIDPTLTPQNKNVRFGDDLGAATNEEHELAFYEKHFGESLDRKNAGYKSKGKAGQIKTMEQYYRSVKSCPEETLYTIGKDINPQILWGIYLEHQAWKAETFPQCRTLDASLHVDETDAMPHVHERSVWIGHDAKGMEVVGQVKALSEMGVQPPDPNEKYGKFNNAKQTFSRACRDHFIEICREHGLEIVVEPLPPDKVGLELTEYKIRHSQERLSEAEQQLAAATEKAAEAETQYQDLTMQNQGLKAANADLRSKRREIESQHRTSAAAIARQREQIRTQQGEIQELQGQLNSLNEKVAHTNEILEDAQKKVTNNESLLSKHKEELQQVSAALDAAKGELQQVSDELGTAKGELSETRDLLDVEQAGAEGAAGAAPMKPLKEHRKLLGGEPTVEISKADFERGQIAIKALESSQKALQAARRLPSVSDRQNAEQALNRRVRELLNHRDVQDEEIEKLKRDNRTLRSDAAGVALKLRSFKARVEDMIVGCTNCSRKAAKETVDWMIEYDAVPGWAEPDRNARSPSYDGLER